MVASTDQIRLLDELRLLVQETHGYHAEPEIRAALTELSANLNLLAHRLRCSERFVLAVIGLSNVGKSTLLNALLGHDLAPRRNGPWTAAPIEFERGERWEVAMLRRDSIRRDHHVCQSATEVQERLGVLAAGSGSEVSQRVKKVVVKAPIELLSDGLVLADTPGFGAAQTGATRNGHALALQDYLQREVSQVFWVVLAEQGIGKTEKAFHDEHLAGVCHDILITGAEDWDTRDRERFEERFRPFFGNRAPRMHWISGLRGLKARDTGDAQALEASGIARLEHTIRNLAKVDVTHALQAEASDTAAFFMAYRDPRRRRLKDWWRPDSWQRWLQRGAACNGLKEKLVQQLSQAGT